MCAVAREGQMRGVSVGGGTGQPNAIRALHSLDMHVSAVVAMVDDGGSTGILRKAAGVLPPGDVRKCLTAMSADPTGPLAAAFEHRFDFADGHALGNLILTALSEHTGSFGEAVDICNKMLGCHGEVIPSTLDDVVLCGISRDGQQFTGQAALGTGPCALSQVWLAPQAPQANERAVAAIMEADVVVLGPGSLFTSVIPNLLVPGIREALVQTAAPIVFVCSMADMQGETWGLSAEEHVEALLAHGMEGVVDTVLIHRPVNAEGGIATRSFEAATKEEHVNQAASRARSLKPNSSHDPDPDWYFRPVEVDDAAIERIAARVPQVVVKDFSDPLRPTWHNVGRLASAVQGVLATCRSQPK